MINTTWAQALVSAPCDPSIDMSLHVTETRSAIDVVLRVGARLFSVEGFTETAGGGLRVYAGDESVELAPSQVAGCGLRWMFR